MWIRTYDEVDPFDVYRLNLASFGWGIDDKTVRRVRRMDPFGVDGFAVYAGERGSILAQVVPLAFPVRLTTGIETVGGLAGVCSHPSVWGHGYARRLMEEVHDRFRSMGLRVSTLTTSRNIRGYGVYRALGYVDLGPFYRASRRLPTKRLRPGDMYLRTPTRKDLPRMNRLFEGYTKDLLGWTARHPRAMDRRLAWNRNYLRRYRLVFRRGRPVGYLRTRPEDGYELEEVIVPRENDFRAAVRLMESRSRGRVIAVNWLTSGADRDRFEDLGYTLDGPIPDTTMALGLTRTLRTADLPRLFGVPPMRFAHYPTDDF